MSRYLKIGTEMPAGSEILGALAHTKGLAGAGLSFYIGGMLWSENSKQEYLTATPFAALL